MPVRRRRTVDLRMRCQLKAEPIVGLLRPRQQVPDLHRRNVDLRRRSQLRSESKVLRRTRLQNSRRASRHCITRFPVWRKR
ncbi:MAG: hypothetical protein ABW185_04350 [Sedimenticola sp.]